MGFWEILVIGIGLSMDAFAVAVCKGLSFDGINRKKMATVGLYFGGFQALMPCIGYFLGYSFRDKISAIDHWIAFVLLTLIGLNMAREAVSKEEEKVEEDVNTTEETVEENPLEKELADTKEQLLRLTAEYANFRKRSEKEKSESFTFATAKAVGEILSVVDNLERALSNEQEDYEGLKKGVQMTFDGLMASLEKLGVTVYGESGDQFDPNFHNAVMHIEDENLDENVITDVFQKGYRINDKVVRPAMVKTAN